MSERAVATVGGHTLVCADCGGMGELPDGGADALVASPPYADAKDYGDPRASFPPEPAAASAWFAPKIREFLRVLRPGGTAVLVAGPRLAGGEYHPWREQLMLDMRAAGFAPWEVATWHKRKFQPASGRFGQATEWIQMYRRRGGDPWLDLDAFRQPYSERSLRNMEKDGLVKRFSRQKMEQAPWEYPNVRAEWRAHPMGAAARNHFEVISDGQKRARFRHYAAYPEELAAKFVAGCCPPGGTVVDPFSGTATTGVACARLGRRYVGYELVREWHEVGAARLAELVPQTPEE